MAGLQRSVETFRRTGSSGLVWEDRFFSGDLNQMRKKEEGIQLRHSQSVGTIGMMQRSKPTGGRVFQAGFVSPAIDPPSPKVSGCGFCAMFGKAMPSKTSKANRR